MPDSDLIKKRYNRTAFYYDLLEAPMEKFRFSVWRSRFRSRITGPRALEVGVGTGKNIPYYPENLEITAIDFSPRMLAKAKRKALELNRKVELTEMDIQRLSFPDKYFDTVFASCVFCSVPNPIEGLIELNRVCKPDGKLILLEHMRPENPILGLLFDFLNPLVVRMVGANINRKTVDNIQKAGWRILVEERLSSDIIRWIEAAPGP